jgi:hypothetical protein
VVGALVVFSSKLVLSCHHKDEDEPVPQWLITIYRGWIGKVAGVHGTVFCCKPKDTSVINISSVSVDPPKTPSDELQRQEKDVNWPDITRFLDKLLFRFFMTLTCLQQLVLFVVFVYGYNSG